MLDSLSVPRRSYDLEDYIDILRRNVRWIIAPAFLGLVLATVIAFRLQDTYVSYATIRITPAQVPTRLFETINSQDLADHVSSMTQTITSRTVLENLITSNNLYEAERKKMPMEDVISVMRPAIRIQGSSGYSFSGKMIPAIQISFAYRDRFKAQKVCQDIVGRFIDENVRSRGENQVATNDFLMEEYTQAKKNLEEAENKLADFQTRNAGRLPDQVNMNVQQLNVMQTRVGQIEEAINQLGQQRMMLDTQIQVANQRLNAVKDVNNRSQNQHIASIDNQIGSLENSIAQMKEKYTDVYPDLVEMRSQLEFLRRQREQAVVDAARQEKENQLHPAPVVDNPATARERLDANAVVEQLKTQIKSNEMETARLRRELGSANGTAAGYAGRLQNLPVGEKEYSDIIRDRDLARQKYFELENKRQLMGVSLDIEKRKQGESLEILDPAVLPSSPSAPKRPIMLVGGLVGGLVLGVVFIALRELKDTSLKSLKDARLYTNLAILGSIPLLENDAVVQRRKQFIWLGWATGTLLGIAVIAGSVARYYLTKV